MAARPLMSHKPSTLKANAYHAAHKIDTNKDCNYTMLQAFEWNSAGGGKHWKYLSGEIDALAAMGITALWLPPPTKASSPQGNGYDIYDLYDLGEFDQKGQVETKWGNKEDLVAVIKKAKDAGIVSYIDAVLNHKAGADYPETFKVKEVDQEDRTKEISDVYEIEGWTGFDFKARGDKYSKTKWHSYHFTGVDYDNKTGKNSIFKIQGNGKDWGTEDDAEKGNFDYLMYASAIVNESLTSLNRCQRFADIDYDHPEAAGDVAAWGSWVTKELNIAGFRFDALRHIKEGFISDFLNKVRDDHKTEIFAVGEFFVSDVSMLEDYLNKFDGTVCLFDTPLHQNFKQAADQGPDYDLRKIFDGSLVQKRSTEAVTFVDNHDTQPGQTVESWIAPAFKPLAYALILLRHEGYPCVFAGDLWGLADENGKLSDAMSSLSDFIKCRQLFAYGETRDYWDHKNTIGWVRVGDEDHDGCAVVLCNGTQEGSKFMEVGKEHDGEVWSDVLGWSQKEVTIKDGWAEFFAPASSMAIYTKKEAKGRDSFGR